MRVLVIGQNPSKHNDEEDIAFIGSKSYIRLGQWLEHLGLNSDNSYIINASNKVGKVAKKDVDVINLMKHLMFFNPTHIVCLGSYARDAYEDIKEEVVGPDAFHMPHPSGLNRLLNDESYVNRALDDCLKYLSQTSFHRQ